MRGGGGGVTSGQTGRSAVKHKVAAHMFILNLDEVKNREINPRK